MITPGPGKWKPFRVKEDLSEVTLSTAAVLPDEPEKKGGEDMAEEGVRERSVQVESDSSTLLERVVEEEGSSPLGRV